MFGSLGRISDGIATFHFALAASHVPVLVDVLENIGEHDYEFMSGANYDVLLREDWREGHRILACAEADSSKAGG